ncbi:hypothetical protein Bca52824_091138 [Brassica carinata]|uniref:Uncharacterized protein n=1 Tax=Brassica carinata TaxID=52824 RepID=A0A8X7NX57_BRACI|nr:hypothetical protein Bca52824_091138 [Brassica carinata]
MDRIFSFLRTLLVSRYNLVQTNAAASLVNLSLEKRNKVKIGNLRFRGLASEVGAEEVLKEVEESGNVRVKENAANILQVMRGGSGGGSAFGENGEARVILFDG